MKSRTIVATILFLSLATISYAHDDHFSEGDPSQFVEILTEQMYAANLDIWSSTVAGGDAEILDILTSLSTARMEAMIDLLKRESPLPQTFLSLVLTQSERENLPFEVQYLVEQPAVVTGALRVVHVHDEHAEEEGAGDDADSEEEPPGGTSAQAGEYRYFIDTGTSVKEFYPTRDIELASGATVQVSGYQMGDVLVSDISQNGNLQLLASPSPVESVGAQRVLFLLVDMMDSPPRPFTPEEIYAQTLSGPFQAYFQEQSFQRVSFIGEVRGWYRVPRNANNGSWCAKPQLSPETGEIDQIILANQINLSAYDRLVIVLSTACEAGGGSSTVGKSLHRINGSSYYISVAYVSVSSPSSHVNSSEPVVWSNMLGTLSHEMGHSLGVHHANSKRCPGQVLYGDCRFTEYGNVFDAMGHGRIALHFNALYKEKLGWIDPEEALVITQPGRYTINPLEWTESAKKIAKIVPPYMGDLEMYLELRKGVNAQGQNNYDAELNVPGNVMNQNGLIVNQHFPFVFYTGLGWGPSSALLDMAPNEGDRHTLNQGDAPFTDPGSGITIGPVLEVSSSAITFDVNFAPPTCIRSAPSVDSRLQYSLRRRGYVGLVFSSNDSTMCGAAPFRISLSPNSAQWPVTFTEREVHLRPYETKTGLQAHFTIPNNVPAGSHTLEFLVTNLAGQQTSVERIPIEVRPSFSVNAIAPYAGPVGSELLITGTGFLTSGPMYLSFQGTPVTNLQTFVVFGNDPNFLRFTVPNRPSGLYQVSISDGTQTTNSAPFTIAAIAPAPAIVITHPNETVLWSVNPNQLFNFRWHSTAPIPADALLNLSLRNQDGETFPLMANTPNDGSEGIEIPISIPSGVYYTVATVSSGIIPVHEARGAPFTIENIFVPLFVTQPASQTVYEEETVTLTVAAHSEVEEVSLYQWQRNGENISGATSPNYSFTAQRNATPQTYRAIATNSYGSVVSEDATIYVQDRPECQGQQHELIVNIREELQSVLVECVDEDVGDHLTYSIAGEPQHGTAAIHPMTGAVSYTPHLDYVGADAFQIRATDSGGGMAEAQIGVTMLVATPPAPDALHQVIADKAGEIHVGWSDVSNLENRYRVYVNGAEPIILPKNVTYTEIAGLLPNTTYFVEVEACFQAPNQLVCGAKASLNATTLASDPHSIFLVSSGTTFITLGWTTQLADRVDHYMARIIAGDTPPQNCVGGQLVNQGPITFSALQPGHMYSFRVCGVNSAGHHSPGKTASYHTGNSIGNPDGPQSPQLPTNKMKAVNQ